MIWWTQWVDKGFNDRGPQNLWSHFLFSSHIGENYAGVWDDSVFWVGKQVHQAFDTTKGYQLTEIHTGPLETETLWVAGFTIPQASHFSAVDHMEEWTPTQAEPKNDWESSATPPSVMTNHDYEICRVSQSLSM